MVPSRDLRHELASRFRWPAVLLRYLVQHIGHSQLLDSLLTRTSGYDSDFTGGAAAWEQAASMIAVACSEFQVPVCLQPQSVCDSWLQSQVRARADLSGQKRLPEKPHSLCLSAQEIDANMRRSVRWHLPHSCCVFQDILEVWDMPAERAAEIRRLQKLPDQLAYAQGLPRNAFGWCEAHQAYCSFTKSNLRVQGPPCPDWSTAGQRLGTQGQHFAPLLAAGAKTQVTQPDTVIVENVAAFPVDLASLVYGPEYSWCQTFQRPASVGFEFVSRHRTWLARGFSDLGSRPQP